MFIFLFSVIVILASDTYAFTGFTGVGTKLLSTSKNLNLLQSKVRNNNQHNTLCMREVTSWVPGRGLKTEDVEVTRKSITNEIISFYNNQGKRINETRIMERLSEPEVSEKLDGLHILSLMFLSSQKRKKLKNVISLTDALERLNTWDRVWTDKDISTFVYGVRSLECLTDEDQALLQLGAKKINESPAKMNSRAIGNALYGLQDTTSDSPGLLDLIDSLNSKLSSFQGDLNGQDIGIGVYGLQGLSSDDSQVRALAETLASSIDNSETELDAQALGNALYGLQSMSSESSEARKLVKALATKVAESTPELVPQAIGSGLYGLQRMDASSLEVKYLVSSMAEKISASSAVMDAQAVGNAIYGLQKMQSNNAEVRNLIAALATKLEAMIDEGIKLDSKAISMALYGLHSMNSDQPQVRQLLAALSTLMDISGASLSGQGVADALYGLRGMQKDCPELRSLLAAIAKSIDSSKGRLEAIEIANALNGLQGLSSEMFEVRLLASKLAEKINRSKVTLRGFTIGRALSGLQRFSAESSEVRYLIKQLARTLKSSNRVRMTGASIADSVYGLQGLSSDIPEVQELVSEIAKKISSTGATLSSEEIGRSLYGLQGLSSQASIFSDSAIGLDVDEVQFLVSALWDKIKNVRDLMPLNDIGMGLSGITLLKDPISENIRQYLYAQTIRVGTEEAINDMGQPKPEDIIFAVRGLRLNNLRLPRWLEESYLKLESGFADKTVPDVIPMSRADKLVCQKFQALNPNTPMIPNAIFDGFKLDMQFPSIKLNVELDGPTHKYPVRRRFDTQRDEYLSVKQGYLIVRVELDGKSVDEVVAEIDRVVKRRADALADREIQALYARKQ